MHLYMCIYRMSAQYRMVKSHRTATTLARTHVTCAPQFHACIRTQYYIHMREALQMWIIPLSCTTHLHAHTYRGSSLTEVRYFEARVMRVATLSTVTLCQMSLSQCFFSSFSQYESASSSNPAGAQAKSIQSCMRENIPVRMYESYIIGK